MVKRKNNMPILARNWKFGLAITPLNKPKEDRSIPNTTTVNIHGICKYLLITYPIVMITKQVKAASRKISIFETPYAG
jgi:hypothetical protein